MRALDAGELGVNSVEPGDLVAAVADVLESNMGGTSGTRSCVPVSVTIFNATNSLHTVLSIWDLSHCFIKRALANLCEKCGRNHGGASSSFE